MLGIFLEIRWNLFCPVPLLIPVMVPSYTHLHVDLPTRHDIFHPHTIRPASIRMFIYMKNYVNHYF